MRESPAEASEDSQNDSKPQTQDTSQNSNSETDSKTFAEFDFTPRFRKGLRRKKGESTYILHTDSSTEGLGAVLYQKQEGKLRVIAYASVMA